MVGKSSEAVDVYKKILANQYDDETKEEEETEESAEQTEERTEADASGAVSAEKPKKGLWRERLIANAQLVEYGDKAAEIVDFAIIDHKGMITSSVDKNQRFRIKMKIKFHETMEHPIFCLFDQRPEGNGDYRNEYGAGGLHKRRGGSGKDRHGML
mgnify:CR=1 FL=1